MGRLESYQFNQIMDGKWVWKAHIFGVFSCKSFLESLLDSTEELKFPHFDFIWKSSLPTKIKIFNWLAVLGKINTLVRLQNRRPHLSISPSCCVLCQKAGESADHLLLHCELSSRIWAKAFICFGFEGAVPSSWSDFIGICWFLIGSSGVHRVIWKLFVHAIA
ncbi:hypothetical protein LguiA_029716 [Lonicera macranthoides]